MLQATLGRFSLLIAAMLLTGLMVAPASAQSQDEIDLIEQLGQEEVEARKVRAAEQAELEHQARLEEQSRLRAAYREYLGAARRTAQQAVAAKWRAADGDEVARLREQAREIIDRPNLTKAMVQAELDPIYERLEEVLMPSAEELYARNGDLLELRRRIAPGSGNDVAWIELTAILYAMCPDNRGKEVIAGNVEYRDDAQYGMQGENGGIDLCNRRRIVLGLNPCAIDYKLVLCGRDHSHDMRTLGFFAHESPVEGKTTPWDRARNFGTSASGENIAAGYGSDTQATMGWWYSPGHLKNMMGRGHRRIGLGRDQQHYTQLFGG